MSPLLNRYERLGQGLGQPIAPDEAGRLPFAAGPEKVRQAIFTLLDTEPGERVMHPDFGCGLRRYLMAPNNPATRAGIQHEIANTLARWEPRIKVVDIAVNPTEDRAMVLIESHYAPVLDDRSFEDLFAELRNRIPVYNPAWTDHLDSDPGITLLQLFAYLGEGLQFRFNQIPEATQIAFLKLLGIPLHPARPAQALVRFESKVAKGVSLYAGDQVKAGKTLYTIAQDATVWPLDCVAVARRSLLAEADLADNAKVRDFIAGLDAEVGAAVQASIDALELGEDGHVAPD